MSNTIITYFSISVIFWGYKNLGFRFCPISRVEFRVPPGPGPLSHQPAHVCVDEFMKFFENCEQFSTSDRLCVS